MIKSEIIRKFPGGADNPEELRRRLKTLCRDFFRLVGAKVSDKGEFLKIKLPDNCPFEWHEKEFIVGFDRGSCGEKQGWYLFCPGSLLFHHVHRWLKEKAFSIAVELPELKKPKGLKLHFDGCELTSIKRKKVKLRGILVSVAFSCIPDIDGEREKLRSYLVLENGFIEDVTERAQGLLLNAKPKKSQLSHHFVNKLLKLLQERSGKLALDWLSKLSNLARKRLRSELERIVNYYDDLIGEAAIKTESREQFWHQMSHLIAERNERMGEEAQRHCPFILAQVVGIVEVILPAIEFKLTVRAGSVQSVFSAHYDLQRGVLIPPECKICNLRTIHISLCSDGHIACSSCILKCASCGKICCKDCISGFCKLCNSPVCKDCLTSCDSCHKQICKQHAFTCDISKHVICEACMAKCDICGRIACPDDSISCSICGKTICNGCLQKCDEEIFQICPSCEKTACQSHMHLCSACGKIGCTECIVECLTCGVKICTKHSFTANCCTSPLCNKHIFYCQLCGKIVCQEHATQCGICGVIVCPLCSSVCSLCEQRYCAICLKGKAMCSLCVKLLHQPERKLLPSQLPDRLPKKSLKKQWCRFVSTKHIAIYLWRDNLDGLLVVADTNGKTISLKRLNALWLLRHLKD